jgi:carboxylate-amine ligase
VADDRDRAGRTLGVEEEFLLVDPPTGVSVPAADAVLARVAEAGLPAGKSMQRELRASQVEAATGACTTAGRVRDHLVAGRRALADAAWAAGVRVVPVGTPPVARPGPVPVPDGTASSAHYARIDQLYAELTRDYEACGLHVHVGVPDREHAVAVVNHVNRWLPVLLARR